MSYQYQHFGPKYYDFTKFDGPKPGETAPDFTAYNPEGKKVKLSDFKGQWVVLETGSITCPITDSKVSVMDELQDKFKDVVFILLYTREAHPGEQYGIQKTFQEKCDRARKFAEIYDLKRLMLVDDLKGTAHQLYGSMPNSIHIINPEGVVVMRGDWNDVKTVQKVLKKQDPQFIYEQEVYAGKPVFFSKNTRGILKTLKDGGPTALSDFMKTAPLLAWMHFKKFIRGKKTFG